jgi:hypothetical protein
MSKVANVEIQIHMAPFHYTLLEGRYQVTHIDKSGQKGFPHHHSPHIKM